MAELFYAKPFISHAGANSDGVREEVLVQKGLAQVYEIKDNGNGSAQVVFNIPDREYPTQAAWINTDTDAFKLIKKAFDAGQKPLEFRIEWQRRKKSKNSNEPIKPETPIYELMGADENGKHKNMTMVGQNTRKLLVGVAKHGEEMLFSQDLTDPAEDPSGDNGPTSARGQKHDKPVKIGGSAQAHANGFCEVQPWFGQNPTGEVNPGSYGVETELDFYFWAMEQAAKHNVKLTEPQARMLANALANVAGELQVSMYNGKLDEPDRNIGSYTRVRWILKKIAETEYPLTAESMANKEAVTGWLSNVKSKAETLWRWAIEKYAASLGVEPYGDETTDEE